ncbi:MAG: flagellar biosynthetic protein FliO, partial [Treponema sp.]|nr:flagellar biosynthetic protein FliO [Treponema sp.]
VAVGSKVWLVGAAENGVNLISEIEDKETVDAMLLDDSRKVENPSTRFGDFMSLLRRMGVKASSQTPGADAIRERRERLRGL